jgi:hypothetical protein
MALRLAELQRRLADHGIRVEKPRSGSHRKAIKGSVTYPVPAHNGLKTEIADKYLRALCRRFELAEKLLLPAKGK